MSIARINNNINAINANRNLDVTGRSMQKSIERLSSGLRINRAGDDAAGMTVVTRIRSQVRGLDRAIMNAQDGVNLINVAEGALDEMTSRLDRIRVLAVQAANTGVNDLQARQAIQDEVFQSIDEITRIANTTKFGTNHLLNGDFGSSAEIKPGQDGVQNFGINIDQGPSSSTLENGQHFLNIVKTKNGFSQLIPGLDSNGVTRTMHAGIQNSTDIAVTLARFASTAGLNGTAGTSALQIGDGGIFNTVSIQDGDLISFEGVLSDGVTKFSGTVSASNITFLGDSTQTAASETSLLGAINLAIDQAEMSLWGVNSAASAPTSFRTTVTLAANTSDNRGRLLLVSDLETANQSSLNLRLVRNNFVVTKADGVTRSGAIGINSVLSGGGQIGNAVTAITGSTFGTGNFSIDVEDVQGAQTRTIDSTIQFQDHAGVNIRRDVSLASSLRGLQLNGTFVDSLYTGGSSISIGDTITLRGTEADGTTFVAAYTISGSASTDTVFNDFQFATLSGLIAELNYRTRDYTVAGMDGDLSRFETGVVTITPEGKLRLLDDLGRDNSQLSFTLTYNSRPTAGINQTFTIQDKGDLVKEGFAESATFRINGGSAVRAKAGDVITLYGAEATVDGAVQEQITFRVGNNLKVGKDILEVNASEYVGSLNGGPKVTFQNGAQDVVFIDDGSFTSGVARTLMVDFDTILDITKSSTDEPDPGTTIIISAVNKSVNFHIGAFAFDSFRTTLGDLTSQNLGFGRGSGRTVEDIDVTTYEGANEALKIVDEALDQINRTRSLLGAATNRLEGTISNLSVSSENLTAAESRLRDADIARESTEFAKNQILLQSGVSVLAQANFLPQSFLSLLG
ncbi:MAG: flagellin [Candidatus Omnitrophota bacterium]